MNLPVLSYVFANGQAVFFVLSTFSCDLDSILASTLRLRRVFTYNVADGQHALSNRLRGGGGFGCGKSLKQNRIRRKGRIVHPRKKEEPPKVTSRHGTRNSAPRDPRTRQGGEREKEGTHKKTKKQRLRFVFDLPEALFLCVFVCHLFFALPALTCSRVSRG
jgi:hypothetical protein